VCAAILTNSAYAQPSTTPITVLVGFPAGGNVDVIARRLADSMQAALNRPVVVENKVGAGGQIATQTLARADASGTTLLLSNEHAISIVPLTKKNPGYDVSKDILPVATVATLPIGLAVHPSVKANSLDDFGAWARAKQDPINVGVPAAASLPDFAVGIIGKALKRPLTSVPYRGGAPLVNDLIGGHVLAGVTGLSELLENHKSGNIRILAVSGSERSALLPSVPTFTEVGIKGLEQPIFIGLFAPAATPPAILDRYREAVRSITGSDDFRKALFEFGVQATYGDAQDLKSRVDGTLQTWAPIIRESGFTPN
jgi:tripartite-type tricarboxylate transporter receptor subunit TctC